MLYRLKTSGLASVTYNWKLADVTVAPVGISVRSHFNNVVRAAGASGRIHMQIIGFTLLYCTLLALRYVSSAAVRLTVVQLVDGSKIASMILSLSMVIFSGSCCRLSHPPFTKGKTGICALQSELPRCPRYRYRRLDRGRLSHRPLARTT
jgi:hypothetical protein